MLATIFLVTTAITLIYLIYKFTEFRKRNTALINRTSLVSQIKEFLISLGKRDDDALYDPIREEVDVDDFHLEQRLALGKFGDLKLKNHETDDELMEWAESNV